MRWFRVVALTATLLAVAAANPAFDCDLSNPAALSGCIKRLLLESRDKVRQEADPLHLPNENKDDIETKNIVVRGIAGYEVDHLAVTFPNEQQIAVTATIAWPHIVGDLFVRIKKCKKIFWKKRCVSASAEPHVTVGRTSGTLTTTLQININEHGEISVDAKGTRVSLNLPRIHVTANIRNKVGSFLNKIIGKPADKIASKLANKWWGRNKGKIEGKARAALDKAVNDKLSVQLGDLLKV